MEGRTSFVIAHRLNTVRKADLVFVMEQWKTNRSWITEGVVSRNKGLITKC